MAFSFVIPDKFTFSTYTLGYILSFHSSTFFWILTIYATIDPVARINHSKPLNAKPVLTSFNALAPSIVGTARKNENSVAIYLDVPSKTAPIIVDPDLPGINAKHWNKPIPIASL